MAYSRIQIDFGENLLLIEERLSPSFWSHIFNRQGDHRYPVNARIKSLMNLMFNRSISSMKTKIIRRISRAKPTCWAIFASGD